MAGEEEREGSIKISKEPREQETWKTPPKHSRPRLHVWKELTVMEEEVTTQITHKGSKLWAQSL